MAILKARKLIKAEMVTVVKTSEYLKYPNMALEHFFFERIASFAAIFIRWGTK